MSAYVVNKRHIDAIVTGALEVGQRNRSRFSWYHEGTRHEVEADASADALGQLLWTENVASVQARYPDTIDGGNYPGPVGFTPADAYVYTFEPLVEALTMVELLLAISGLEYQSCEHAGWKTSEAYTVLDTLRRAAIHYLPGYEEAGTWEVDPDRPVKRVFHSYR